MVMFKNVTKVIRLEKVNREKLFYEILTATFSHEMKTPLNSMMNLLNELD
jgi:signal transduction histidine kinase